MASPAPASAAKKKPKVEGERRYPRRSFPPQKPLFQAPTLAGNVGFSNVEKMVELTDTCVSADMSPTCRPTCRQHDLKWCRPRY